MNGFWEALGPALGTGLGLVLIALITWGLTIFQKYTGIKIDEKHMNVLHSAIMTGSQAAVASLGPGAAKEVLVNRTLEHVRRSAPDALQKLHPPEQVLTNLAVSAIERAINPTIIISDVLKQMRR